MDNYLWLCGGVVSGTLCIWEPEGKAGHPVAYKSSEPHYIEESHSPANIKTTNSFFSLVKTIIVYFVVFFLICLFGFNAASCTGQRGFCNIQHWFVSSYIIQQSPLVSCCLSKNEVGLCCLFITFLRVHTSKHIKKKIINIPGINGFHLY